MLQAFAFAFESANFVNPRTHSSARIPLGVRCVTTPGQDRSTMAQWSDQA